MANLDSSASSAPGTTPSARPNVARPPSFLSRVSSNHGPWLLLLGVITLLLCLYALQTAHEKKKFLRAAQQTTVTAAKYARSAQASAVWVAEQLDRLEGSITDARRAETSLAIPIAEYEARQRGIERRIQRAEAAMRQWETVLIQVRQRFPDRIDSEILPVDVQLTMDNLQVRFEELHSRLDSAELEIAVTETLRTQLAAAEAETARAREATQRAEFSALNAARDALVDASRVVKEEAEANRAAQREAGWRTALSQASPYPAWMGSGSYPSPSGAALARHHVPYVNINNNNVGYVEPEPADYYRDRSSSVLIIPANSDYRSRSYRPFNRYYTGGRGCYSSSPYRTYGAGSYKSYRKWYSPSYDRGYSIPYRSYSHRPRARRVSYHSRRRR